MIKQFKTFESMETFKTDDMVLYICRDAMLMLDDDFRMELFGRTGTVIETNINDTIKVLFKNGEKIDINKKFLERYLPNNKKDNNNSNKWYNNWNDWFPY
jgi:hypothetical protein